MAMPRGAFDPNSLSDDALNALRRFACDNMPARVLAEWVYGWADAEQARRAKGEAASEQHALGLPAAFNWSAADLADALEVANVLSYSVRNLALGEFIDRLALFLTSEAAERLRNGA